MKYDFISKRLSNSILHIWILGIFGSHITNVRCWLGLISCVQLIVFQKRQRSGLSTDFPWIFHGQSMDLSYADVHLFGSNSRRSLFDLGSR